MPRHRAGNFAIYGEVSEQGVYEIGQPILLTEAIAMAGGLIRFSDFAKIQILRGDPQNPEALRVNLKEVLAKKKVELLPVIHPGDTIYIPRNLLSKWFDFVEVIRGARHVTEDFEEMRDHWTLRDIDRD
ncbi:MAG: SLBB domain-containing protein [Candidatus Omnitrophica bacterium]|nr:SLBB domain-containing protein [Candidatus Omnitrophota bacterium]